MAVGGLDLALEQVVLIEQEPDLEGDLLLELRDDNGRRRRGLELLGLRASESSVAGARIRVASVESRRRVAARAVGATRRTSRAVRQVGSSNSSPSSGNPSSTSRTRRWQTCACSWTSVIAKRAAWRSSTPASGSRMVG